MKEQASVLKRRSGLFFLLFGLLILASLLYYVDLNLIIQSFHLLGSKILLVFFVAILWIANNTLCLATLLKFRVPFHHLLYNQITGDAYNVITPLAGLGGEPYKVKHLTNWIPLSEASEAVLRDRLIHSLSGMIFTSLTVLIVAVFMPLGRSLLITFAMLGVLFTILSAILTFLIFSNVPNKFLGKVLKKLKLLEEYRSNPLDQPTFLKALFFKVLARILNMVELLLIFLLLGISPGFFEIVTISALIALSGTLLFVVPQGIGVNEAGISGAFKLIGHPLELGLSFGLIRRARILFWALLGVSLHFFVLLLKKKNPFFFLYSDKQSLSD